MTDAIRTFQRTRAVEAAKSGTTQEETRGNPKSLTLQEFIEKTRHVAETRRAAKEKGK